MKKRRRFKQSASLEERLRTHAAELRDEAEQLPPGQEKEALLRRARQNEEAAEISESLKPADCSPLPNSRKRPTGENA